MIIVDTNVLSETMRPNPDAAVVEWLNSQAAETLFIASITLAELEYGMLAMPDGRRKVSLLTGFRTLLDVFDDRILPFDVPSARHYAVLAASARSRGLGFPNPDGYIAAIAAARGFAVATRDTSAFDAAGLRVINPWQ